MGGRGSGGEDGPPEPGYGVLHAPWRSAYMRMLAESREGGGDGGGAGGSSGSCFLRDYWLNPAEDEGNLVVVRTGTERTGGGGMILLNRFPYASGHLLVALGEGRGRLLEYDQAQRSELWSLVDLATELAEETLACQGVNIGVNQGMAAGAGVPEHLHVHVVPRWGGDVNFVTVVGGVRVIPAALEEMASRYRETWERMRPRA